jgi:murein DD-endopeptidase MepM/ murein hydrolase activator NlpD
MQPRWRNRTALTCGLLLGLLWLISAYQTTSTPASPLETAAPLVVQPEVHRAFPSPAAARLPIQPRLKRPRPAAPASPRRRAEPPLQLVFPTPHTAAPPAWRPPLYPLPWAPTPYDHFYFARPVSADQIGTARSDYRYGGVFYEDIVHAGVDIPADPGTPVLAAGPGKVVWAGYGFSSGQVGDQSDPYGMAVFIRHDFGYQGQQLYTLYAHMERVDVIPGQRVETGQQLGLSGQTGKVSGPHLHFEVRLEQDDQFSPRNPELWLAPPQGWGVLAGRVFNSGGRRLLGQLVEVHDPQGDQVWMAYTYGEGKIPADDYYQENLVIGDLPAGTYTLQINYLAKIYRLPIEIRPGLVTTFSFRGRSGFTNEPLALPGQDFSPPAAP